MQISDCFEINVPNPEVKLARNTELAFIKYTGVIAFTVLLVRWMSPSQSFQISNASLTRNKFATIEFLH